MKIMMNCVRALGLAGILTMGAYLATSCNKPQRRPLYDERPFYDVTLTMHSPWIADPVVKNAKIQDSCSYENSKKKYIMSGGQLYCLDKAKNTVDTLADNNIDMSDYEFELFDKIASNSIEIPDTVSLSARDIIISQEDLPERLVGEKPKYLHVERPYGFNSEKTENGIKLHVTNHEFVDFLEFKYNK